MTKKYSKYFYMFTITMISLGLFNTGCTVQQKRTETLETKMDTLSHSVEGLEPEISGLEKKLDEQVAEIEASLSVQGNLLQEIKQNLDLVEEDKGKMKVQLDELGTQLNRLESLSKITSAETNLTEDLLNDAIKLYRQQKFEEAISKWEEVLAHNSGKLEAKFFIEISKDKIKQKEIHEELKALLIQRE